MPPLFQCRRQLEDQPVSETRLTQVPRPRARRDRSRHRRRPAAALHLTTSAACSSRTRSCTACRRTSPSWPPGTATSTSPWLQSRLPRGSHQRGGKVDHGIIEGSCRGPAGGTRGGVRRGTGPGWGTRESAYGRLLLMAHVSRWRAAEDWTPAGCRWMRQSGARLRGGRAATCSSGP
jgi:hypothetical protein